MNFLGDDDHLVRARESKMLGTIAVNTMPRLAAANDDLVLMIHGTFAGHQSDEGDRWWQKGSPAARELSQRLPAGVSLPEQGEVFHWSGDNSERARIKAGHELLDRLLELEGTGRGYHLIGHSHGGSVIWHALRLAALRSEKLGHLKSWTTVGTPFLHYRTRGAWSPANIVSLAVALLLLKPAYKVFFGFFHFAWSAVTGSNVALEIHSDQEVGMLMAFCRAPLLKLVEWVGVPVSTIDTGLRIGSYDPASGQSLSSYLFFSWEGWVITLVILCGAYFFLILSSFFLNPVLESLRIRAEKRLERKAMETYRGRWLGLWSTNDEAMNGLRATLDLTISFVNQIAPRERILLSDYLSLLSQPYSWMLAPTFNHLLRPWLDRFVRSFVIKTAQGNNRPTAEVIAVSPFPVSESEADTHPALPAEVNDQLVDRANEHARDIAPKLRDLLSQPSFIAGLEKFGSALSGQELIHTSYFDHAPIMDLLALHITWAHHQGQSLLLASNDEEKGLGNWFREFKQSVHETVDFELRSRRVPQPQWSHTELIRPRRRQGANEEYRKAS